MTTEPMPDAADLPRPLCLACNQPLMVASAIRVHPTCDHNPDAAASELFGVIANAITNQPRSLQKRIGPSEVGVPCDRRIGFKLAGAPEINNKHGVGWTAFIGTAVHEQFAQIFGNVEMARWDAGEAPRWYVEERVTSGQISDTDIDGNCDLFDTWTGNVWDWKITTKNKIRETYRPHGPGDQYTVQAHSYGRGWAARGFDVRNVGIVFMTRDGQFTDRHVWHAPFQPEISARAFDRATRIDQALIQLGPEYVLPELSTAESYCNYCPWFKANSTHVPSGCPGHPKEAHALPTLAEALR